jgi:Transcriptional regulator
MITLVQLEYVIAVDKYRNFAKASEHCFVTQPTLSMQIKKLEDDLGVKIFDRSLQPVCPTEIGKEIIEQAKIVLSESDRLDNLVKTFRNDYSGDLHIGIIPTLGPYLLPHFAGPLKRHFPNVNLKIEEQITEQIIINLKTTS